MRMWNDKRTSYYDFDTHTLYLETVFGMASFVITPFAILANIDDPFVVLFFVAIALGLIGLIIAIVNIISGVRSGRTNGLTFSGFGLAASVLGIAISVLAFFKFVI